MRDICINLDFMSTCSMAMDLLRYITLHCPVCTVCSPKIFQVFFFFVSACLCCTIPMAKVDVHASKAVTNCTILSHHLHATPSKISSKDIITISNHMSFVNHWY
jgi:hypothetical protein